MLKSHILLEDAPTQHPPAPPSKGDDDPRPAPDEKCVARPPESLPAYGGLARLWWACPPMVGLPAYGGLARLWWACPPVVGLPACGGLARPRREVLEQIPCVLQQAMPN